MNHIGTQKIITQRTVLRKLENADAESLFLCGLGKSIDEATSILDNMITYYDNPMNYNWGIEYKGVVVGRVAVNEISARDCYMQIAYDVGAKYRNLGLTTEAVIAVINFLLKEVNVHRIFGQCRVTNIASQRVLQKAGFIFEGRQRKHYLEPDGTFVDVDIYGIIQEDITNVGDIMDQKVIQDQGIT